MECCSQAIDNSLRKHPVGVPITKEMANELVKAAMEEITPWIIHKSKED